MSLITCPECGTQISDRAATCPRCGFPVAQVCSRSGNDISLNFSVKDMRGGLVTFVCDCCGCEIEEPSNFVYPVTPDLFTLNYPVECPCCGAREEFGAKISTTPDYQHQRQAESGEMPPPKIYCPCCGGDHIQAVKRGFSVKKAVIGTAIFGPAGALGGAVGANEIEFVCIECGTKWDS